MKKISILFLGLVFILLSVENYSQSCAGIFSFDVINPRTGLPIGVRLQKKIWYVYFNSSKHDLYDKIQGVKSFEQILN